MNQHDLDLIEKAKKAIFSSEINPDEAETEEGRRILDNISSRLWHREEYKSGIL